MEKVKVKHTKKYQKLTPLSTPNELIATDSKKKLTDEYLINLAKANPNLNTKELAKLAGTSYQTILTRLKQINSDDVGANYCKKSTQKFTDEYLIDLVNKNPTLSIRELSKISDASATTISNRIKQINRNGERVKRVKKASKSNRAKPWTANPKLADEYLINLINNNPDLNMDELATLTDSSQFTDEFLIGLVNDNPDLNIEDLAALTDSSKRTILNRIIKTNRNGLKVNYKKKDTKFTDEFLIGLINESPDLNQEELAVLTDTHMNTISRRINQISSRGESINYVRKCSMHKFTDEFLIDLVNQNPDLNMTELAKLAGVTAATISRRIKEINTKGVKVNYANKNNQKDIFIPYE
ncbi:hypothetical protein CONCODRAFT_2069, partial [Conidiobolus coronatus NRRL 28638]